MNEVKAVVTSEGHRIITVMAETPRSFDTTLLTWKWDMTANPDELQHASTEIIRALCQHVFLVEGSRAEDQRRNETLSRKALELTRDFTKRIDELERALARVRLLHRRDEAGYCHESGMETYPCQTIRALASDPVEKPDTTGYLDA